MMTHAALYLFVLLVQSDPTLDALIREGREHPKVMEHLDHLTNKIGPRLTSSERLTKACEWTRDQFAAWGLDARLEEWGTFQVGFDRGPWSAKMTAPEALDLTIGTEAWSPGTKGPVKGPAVLAPTSDEELLALKPKLKGAWLFSTARGPEKYQVAYDEAGIAGLIRSATKELIITGGRANITWEDLPTRVRITMVASQHGKIVGLLKEGKDVELTIDIQNTFKKGPIKVYNVIADLKGVEKPDEMVIIGGHIDSWDGATGTTDNGTGVSTTLEAARLLTMAVSKAGAKPKRTIRFMLWSGEEQGLLGSRAWIKAHPEAMDKISAVIVHDGGTNYVSGINATEKMVPLFEKIFAPAQKLDEKLPFAIRKVPGLPRGIGSDHDAFLAKGVPGFFWNQGRTAEKGQVYSHEHHTQHDLYAAAIPEFQKHSAIVIATGAWGLANLDGLLPRDGLTSTATAENRRMLGVQCDDEMVVQSVVPDSAALKAGVKEGDRIVKFAGKAVPDNIELRKEIQVAPAQTTVTVKRDGKELDLPVTFGK
ncbi:MAG TPA: M20/M25/M40 family metallo-hydrolase [Planctomycetota bacterium]